VFSSGSSYVRTVRLVCIALLLHCGLVPALSKMPPRLLPLAFAPGFPLASFIHSVGTRVGPGGTGAPRGHPGHRRSRHPPTAGSATAAADVPAQSAVDAGAPTSPPLPASGATHTVTYRGRPIDVSHGTRLRTALIHAGATPHNGGSKVICCRGLGTCGTCAVAVRSPPVGSTDAVGGHPGLSPPLPSARERARLAFPPHTAEASAARGLRLACQVRVVGDVTLAKGEGFWGHQSGMLPPLAEG